ncbi:MAG TPA: nuclear pore complex subunit [Flavobacteriales bacterium]|nr:nuclear pore complex subunit [Flavobacteriales bacterium]|tara:strand:+ start:12704 stop:13078 length:375 start_codon:yes stop_codon:yes gene_type:complete
MESIKLEGTPKTPTVEFSAENGVLLLKGRSIPENSIEFYKPLINWIENYSASAPSETVLNVQLEYFNTSSSKCLLDIFKRLERVGNPVTINWYYEEDDEDMLEAGEDYDAIIDIPFKMIEVEEI